MSMEYFGFASGSSKTGPTFPYMPESVLNSYPNTLLEHPVVPTAVGFLNTYIQTPDAKNLITVVQTWADKSLELLEKPAVQALGFGLSASICAYGAWRIRKRWRNNIVKGNNDLNESLLGEVLHTVGSFDIDLTDPNTDITQRQLFDTRGKLNDLRYLLNRLEGEKDMLAAEVSMRKKIVAQLQGEIHIERDKRRQAELRMEMMEWENTHLRRLRKDVAVKEGKIDMLESCLKEKDEIHDKLFQENVIVPKSVAEARAKEYEILHTKVQKYEMDAVMKRNSEAPYKPSRHESVTSIPCQTPYEETTATMETALQPQGYHQPRSSESYLPSDWDRSPSSTNSVFPPIIYATNLMDRTKTLFRSTTNWSNSKATAAHGQEKAGERTCRNERLVKDDDWEETMMGAKSQKLQQRGAVSGQQNSTGTRRQGSNRKGRFAMCATCPEYSSQTLDSMEDERGVLVQIKSFFSGFSHSGSESGLATIAGSPAQMADLLTSQSRIWDRSFEDKANNCCQEDDEDDACCLSVSDGQSSIFMSASCGSDPSDDDTRDVSRSFKDSCARGHSLKRTASSAKAKPFKKTPSPAKAGSLKRALPKKRTHSPAQETRCEDASSLNHVSFSNMKTPSEKDTLPNSVKEITLPENKPSAADIETGEQKSTPRQSRARQRCRPRKSRSKLTTNLNASKCSQSLIKVQKSGVQSPSVAKVSPSQALGDIVNPSTNNIKDNDIYKQIAHSRQAPIAAPGYPAISNVGDINKNSAYATDIDSEESWIVITPAM